MPGSKYLKAYIGGRQLDLESTQLFPITISYRREDPDDFQKKRSADALSTTVPATLNNDEIANTFHNPAVEDMTPGQIFRSFRNGVISANGYELLVGKTLLTQARHLSCPVNYEYDWFGNNGDWIIDLKEKTLYDFISHINFTFTKEMIQDSWAFDGTDEDLPFVFAPVRYGQQLDEYDNGVTKQKDMNMKAEYMKPSLSMYWIIYWAFKSLGYRISSNFLDSEFFRRQVMPWTFGNFLFSEGTRLNNLDFLAKSTETQHMLNVDFTGFWDLVVTNDSTNGAFDNNGVYDYNTPAKEMKWTYLPAFDYGNLLGTFHLNMAVQAVATANSDVELRVQWFKNGVKLDNGNDNGNGTLLVNLNAPDIGRRDFIGQVDDFLTVEVTPTDIISAKIYLHTFKSSLGIARIHASVDAFELDYFRIPIGGNIDFQGYESFKKYKFLDFLQGVCDLYNISPGTDPINKVVYLEPEHPYSTTNSLSATTPGYLTGNISNWNRKQDLSKMSELSLFSDGDREQLFIFKQDSNDGILKVVQDRFSNVMGQAKYALPDRFKAGFQERPNRFFSPVMHVELTQWKNLGTGDDESPQIVCLVPENISNTSRNEAQNTFEPKVCYYKGIVDHVGWIFDDDEMDNYPFMFAVNYQEGGENDPILSYCDERIGPDNDPVLGKGLLRRFFLQRMAIQRNGQYYNTSFNLKNIDVTNYLHREHIICRGQKWELVEIKNYAPLQEQSTECFLRKWSPVTEADSDNVFPSPATVIDQTPPTGTFDLKYNPLKCLISDIPTEQ